MAELALETKQLGFQLEQVQDFTPTPMTIATEMFYAEMLPDGSPLYVAKTPSQKAGQKQFFFWYIPENRPKIRAVLERLKMGKLSRLLLSRTANAEGKEYHPSEEREANPEARERERQKREERAQIMKPKKEKKRWTEEEREQRNRERDEYFEKRRRAQDPAFNHGPKTKERFGKKSPWGK
jgi:hypothetical protein